ncbi:hypothetical protein AY599_23665 [Leptolyngbya valderiana BDU 20041]|nr:hypothetical protein AY599_23665 [Leptolyngbya valderiana BDU 20041]
MRRFSCRAAEIRKFHEPTPKGMTRWRPIRAVAEVIYEGGYCGDDLINGWGPDTARFRLRRTMVVGVDGIKIGRDQYSNCAFRHCAISSIHVSALAGCYFERCDFSSTRIHGPTLPSIENLRGHSNYYREMQAPFHEHEGGRNFLDGWEFATKITNEQYLSGWGVDFPPAEQATTNQRDPNS